MLTQDTAAPEGGLLDLAAAISWFDWTAIVVLAVFLVLGAFKGVAWQAGRLAILVAAYAVAIGVAPAFARSIGSWFSGTGDPDLPLHVARTSLFVAVLVVVGIVVWFAQRFLGERPLTPSARLSGAVLGSVSGGLLVLALLTGVQMFFGERGLARAAEGSGSAVVGRRALELAERVLPADLAAGARSWRGLLRDPTLAPPAGEVGGRPGESWGDGVPDATAPPAGAALPGETGEAPERQIKLQPGREPARVPVGGG